MSGPCGSCLREMLLSQLRIHHEQEHRQPTDEGHGPDSAHQGQDGHDPPLPPGKTLISSLGYAGLCGVGSSTCAGWLWSGQPEEGARSFGVGPPGSVFLCIPEIFANGHGNPPASNVERHLSAGVAPISGGILGFNAPVELELGHISDMTGPAFLQEGGESPFGIVTGRRATASREGQCNGQAGQGKPCFMGQSLGDGGAAVSSPAWVAKERAYLSRFPSALKLASHILESLKEWKVSHLDEKFPKFPGYGRNHVQEKGPGWGLFSLNDRGQCSPHDAHPNIPRSTKKTVGSITSAPISPMSPHAVMAQIWPTLKWPALRCWA